MEKHVGNFQGRCSDKVSPFAWSYTLGVGFGDTDEESVNAT